MQSEPNISNERVGPKKIPKRAAVATLSRLSHTHTIAFQNATKENRAAPDEEYLRDS